MTAILLARAAYVLPFIEMLDDIGAPVYRALERNNLPTALAQNLDSYLPKRPIIRMLTEFEYSEAIDDLGFQATQQWRNGEGLNGDVLAYTHSWPTLLCRLTQFARLCQIEDPDVRIELRPEGLHTRIVVSNSDAQYEISRFEAWAILFVLLGFFRDVLGSHWLPTEITIQNNFVPCDAVAEMFSKTRLITGTKLTSIKVPASLLSQPIGPGFDADRYRVPTPSDYASWEAVSEDLVSRLKAVLRSGLGESNPSLGLAADIAGMSVRTLQRHLGKAGVSFSGLLQQVKFEQAADMLANSKTKIIDIAFSLGYEDPSHFSRAFRRIAGVTPRTFRNQRFAGGHFPSRMP